MKNNDLNHTKFEGLLEKSVIIIPIIVFCFLIFNNISQIHNKNLQIQEIENGLSNINEKVQGFEKDDSFSDNVDWIDYDLWLKKCASISNMCIYDSTNNLKVLSEKSQEELDEISKEFKLVKDTNDYSKIVKFIIIDKSKSTYLTNDIDNIELIKSNVKEFSEENGELFKYVSDKGKWYNISYNSQSTPFYRTYNKLIINEENNFVEAYWFPKNYIYSKEDETMLRSLADQAIKVYKNEIDYEIKYIEDIKKGIFKNKVLIIIYLAAIIFIILCLYLIGKEKIIKCIKNTFIVKAFCNINTWFERKSTFFKMSIFMLCTTLTIFIISYVLILQGDIFYIDNVAAFWILIYFVFIFPKAIKFTRYIDEIMQGIDKIISGNLDNIIEEKGDKSLLNLAHNINTLNKGFKVSIEDQIKNEKLKSELVTNVSHDLKTPLTSIVNYTDILMRENISAEEREEFLKILNRKSLKLKSLIEDLFEISKINSGKVELNKEIVDVAELINQSVAEYSDTESYTDKNLKFIIKTFKKRIEMNLDGNKMSRVFENLINNALKYSLNNTRVYVEIEDIGKGIKICFKNISAVPLDFDKEEIFERFTRGDKSRSTDIDGSGLGLAIAKSIVELHNGIMYIDFDGDLFKSIIELYY